MQVALFAISNVVRAHRTGLAAMDESTLEPRLREFLRVSRNHTQQENEWFYDEYYDEISMIFKEAIHYWRISGRSPTLRSAIDSLRAQLPNEKRFTTGITHIFGLFIQGITYFAQEFHANALPVYHRMTACGSANGAFQRTLLQCQGTTSHQDRQRTKQRIHTCYLERLIYDAIFKQWSLLFPRWGTETETRQDRGHRSWLQTTREDYNTCFPNSQLLVDIVFENRWPMVLTVTRCVKGKVTSRETYTRTLNAIAGNMVHYNPVVECVMHNATSILIKTQTFGLATSWQRVGPSVVPLGDCVAESSMPAPSNSGGRRKAHKNANI